MNDIFIFTSFVSVTISVIVTTIVLLCLYTYPKIPNLSIEEFSVPALNKTHGHTVGDIYFDLKLRNMNKAIGLYYDDPFSIAFSYYPLKEPFQKYTWVCTLPAFYQGNGKTKHIKSVAKDHLRQTSMVVVEKREDTNKVVESSMDLLVVDLPTLLPSYQGNPTFSVHG